MNEDAEYRVRIPLWLFPAAYFIHVTEEFVGDAGLSLAPRQMNNFNLTPAQFIIINCVGLLLMIFSIAVARWRGFPHFLLIILGTTMLVNGLLHVLDTLQSGAYTPGLITSPLIFIPLGAWTLFRLRHDMRWLRYCAAIALGAGAHLLISLLASNGRNLFGG